jgi:hypothetical protein
MTKGPVPTQINYKKVFKFYLLGMGFSFLLPKNYFLKIMDSLHGRVSDNITVIEKEKYYKII